MSTAIKTLIGDKTFDVTQDRVLEAFDAEGNTVFKIDACGDTSGSGKESTVVDEATYTLLPSDDFLEVDRTATGACSITFPDNQRVNPREVTVVDTGEIAQTNNITIKDTAGATLFTLITDKVSVSLRANKAGTKWYIY